MFRVIFSIDQYSLHHCSLAYIWSYTAQYQIRIILSHYKGPYKTDQDFIGLVATAWDANLPAAKVLADYGTGCGKTGPPFFPLWKNRCFSVFIWVFPKKDLKKSGTPKSSILIGFPLFSPSILGYHYFWKHPYKHWFQYRLFTNQDKTFCQKNKWIFTFQVVNYQPKPAILPCLAHNSCTKTSPHFRRQWSTLPKGCNVPTAPTLPWVHTQSPKFANLS